MLDRPREDDRPRHLWVDASAGVAGDMLLGALVDAGVPLELVRRAVEAVAPGAVGITAEEVRRGGLRALHVSVTPASADQPHRAWADVRALLRAADLPGGVRDRALAVFGRLAGAEARAHGVDAGSVQFHEVGAWDSIADVVGVCAAVEAAGVGTVSASRIALGDGTVRAAHGWLPVPGPAVLELSAGWVAGAAPGPGAEPGSGTEPGSGSEPAAGVRGGWGELATPTGVALLTTLARTCEPMPAMTVTATGVGAGTRDPGSHPNVTRVVLGERAAAPAPAPAPMTVLEANVDDLDPRAWPSVLESLMAAGAADAWLVPVLMKKGRPAYTLCVLASEAARDALRHKVFELTTTLGVRESQVRRAALARSWRDVVVDGEPVRVKVGHEHGRVVQATPEFEDVAAWARRRGLPVQQALDVVSAAAHADGVRVGERWPAPGSGG